MSSDKGTLRGKLLRWLLIPLSILFVFDAIGSYFIATGVASAVYDGELMEIARELGLHVRSGGPALTFDLPHAAERTLLLDQYDKVSYAVRTPRRMLAGNANIDAPPALRPEQTAFYDSEVDGNPVRVAVLQTSTGSEPGAPQFTVQVAETLVKRHLLAEKILVSVILPQLLFLLLAGLLVWLGVAHGLAPLSHLQRAVAARSHLDLSPVDAEDVPSEVDPLIVSINDLMARLHKVLDFQSRFIADAAHQLRTPVAGLKAHIQVALREDDIPQVRRALAHLYTGVERLSRLVAQLLSLARNEPNTVIKLNFEPVDLNRLAFDITMDWVPEAYKKDIDLGFEGAGEQVLINGDAMRLTDLVNNLLDNAIRYTHQGGRVTVRVPADGNPRISISDDGPRIPIEERQRVFERFHRLLGSHTDGSGLGLAIVQEIATLHEAKITLQDDVDGVGNTFTVAFKAAEAIA